MSHPLNLTEAILQFCHTVGVTNATDRFSRYRGRMDRSRGARVNICDTIAFPRIKARRILQHRFLSDSAILTLSTHFRA